MPLRMSLIGLLVVLLATPVLASPSRGARLIVKFETAGPHALGECAETLSTRRRPFRGATADHSESLDRLHRRLEVRGVRALFRRPDGRSFAEQRRRLRARLGRARERHPRRAARAAAVPDLSHVYLLELPEGADAEAAAGLYRADPHVEYAQPDFRVEVQAAPDDPFFWSSGSWGQPYRDLWGLLRIGAESAWELSRGEGIVVAVADTGIDHGHPDIAANIWINPGEDLDGNGSVDPWDLNGVDDDANGYVDDLRGFDFANSHDADQDGDYGDPGDVSDADPFDDNGHGTHVAGTIAAVGDNGLGMIGVAPRARIMPLKGLDENGTGRISDLARAVVYAAENGADVINNSWSCSRRCPVNPVIEEAVRFAHGLGLVLVSSAGNKTDDVAFYSPENMRETLVVAATRPDDRPTHFSNLGLLVDVAAPGGGPSTPPPSLAPASNILSLKSSGSSPVFDALVVDDDYLRLSGTSMSAPHVSGLAALILAARPDFSNQDVRAAIRIGAEDIGPPGHDRASGAGRIDLARSVALEAVAQMRGEITSPAPASTRSQMEGVVAVLGSAAGPDLAEYSLFVGRGIDPESWEPLGPPGATPVEDGVLGLWPVEDLDNGSYALRLVLTAIDGTVFEEFAPLGLERVTPFRVSSPGAPALEPAVSGDLVVWQSERPSPEEVETGGANLFVSDLRSGSERMISGAPGDQRSASISGRQIAWVDRRNGNGTEIYRCRYHRKRGSCPERPVALGPGLRSPPSVSDGRIAWSEDRGGSSDLYLCAPRGRRGRCAVRRVAAYPSFQSRPALDGLRLLWHDDRDGPSKLFTCLLDPIRSRCPAQRVFRRNTVQVSGAVSGSLIAWEDFGAEIALRLCALDPASDRCRSLVLDREDPTASPAISGDRVVWHSSRRGDDRDVFFCEYDRVLRTCPAQRLTGALAPQRNPAIDGNLVAWEDLRSGISEIFGFELPEMEPVEDRVVREGRELRVAVRARDPVGDPLELRVERVGGGDLESLGAEFRELGEGRGELRWTPGFDQSGSYALTFSATTRARLVTSETIRIEVLDRKRPPVSATLRGRPARGSTLERGDE